MYDTFWPNNKVTKILTVNIQHNANRPEFTGAQTATIPETFPPGDVVLTLAARDLDGVSITCASINYFILLLLLI